METLGEGNFVVVAEDKTVAHIELRVSAVKGERLGRVENTGAIVDEHSQGVRDVIEAVCPGVIRVEGQTTTEPANRFDLQGVIVRRSDTLHLGHVVKTRVQETVYRAESRSDFVVRRIHELSDPRILVRQAGGRGRNVRRLDKVDRETHLQVIVVRSDVSGLEHQITDELVFNAQIPLLVPRIIQVLVHRGKAAEIDLRGVKMAHCRSGRGLRRGGSGNQVGPAIRAGGTHQRDTGHKGRREAEIRDGVLVDEVIGNAVASADHELIQRIPCKPQAGRRVPIAMERRASQIYAAERAGTKRANRRRILRIQIRENALSFGNSAGGLQAEADVQCKPGGQAEIILHEPEVVKSKIMQRRVAEELQPFKRRASLESGDIRKNGRAQLFRVEKARRLIAIKVSPELDGVPPARPGKGVQILEGILRAPLRNDE